MDFDRDIKTYRGRILGIDIKDEAIMITEQDILSYVNVGEAEGVIEAEEKDMIQINGYFWRNYSKKR